MVGILDFHGRGLGAIPGGDLRSYKLHGKKKPTKNPMKQ